MDRLFADIQSSLAAGEQQQPPLFSGISPNASDEQRGSNQQEQPTPEQAQQMLEFLLSLEEMRTSNPQAFRDSMKQLGIGNESEDEGGDQPPSQADALKTLISSIQSLRSGEAGGSSSSAAAVAAAAAATTTVEGIKLPGASKNAPKGITITPEAGFSYKTKQTRDDLKVFINICIHAALDPPGLKKRLNDEGEPVEGMNIPMSVGAGRSGIDKKGEACKIFDIIVNPKVVEEANSDKTGKYRDFVCQLGIQCLENKYREELDKRYKLPKLKYMYTHVGAEIESQYVQDRKNMPQIQEVTSDSDVSKAAAAARVKKQAEEAKQEADRLQAQEVPLVFRFEWAASGAGDKEVAESANKEVQSGTTKAKIDLMQNDYIEPMMPVQDAKSDALSFVASIARAEVDLSLIDVKLSPFKLHVKVPGHKLVSVYLPLAILPAQTTCSLSRPEGFARLILLTIVMPVDSTPWDVAADAGSKPWLVAQALQGEDDTSVMYNPYAPSSASSLSSNSRSGAASSGGGKRGETPQGEDGEETLPEERFHLKLPSNVDQYTGVEREEGASLEDDFDLPEDRFHRKDAQSSHLISQREASVKEKWAKHEKEKAERVNDPNIEYIDVDDFKPGGKFGPEQTQEAKLLAESAGAVREELKRASEVVAALAPQTTVIEGLSTQWTELLD